MAKIISQDGKAITDSTAIEKRLAAIGITLKQWPAPTSPRARELMDKQALSDNEKAELLKFVDNRFEELKRDKGYQTRDLVVIHEDIPGLPDMLAKFDKIHTHSDDEVRYILAGTGYFGFVDKDGSQFMLEVTAGDYINVPANAEHWFEMKGCARCKAVRYFIDTAGWTPHYTGRPVALREAAHVLTAMCLFGLLALVCPPVGSATTPERSPYAGQQQRDIKALSAKEVDDYRQGRGMGYAKAAELNRYPGPSHVLELSSPLVLTSAQRQQTQAIYDRMHNAAVLLGRQIVDREASLDTLFAGRKADSDQVERLTREIATLQAQLRFVHLRAHLEMVAVLMPAQIDTYQRLRGYRDGHTGGHQHQH